MGVVCSCFYHSSINSNNITNKSHRVKRRRIVMKSSSTWRRWRSSGQAYVHHARCDDRVDLFHFFENSLLLGPWDRIKAKVSLTPITVSSANAEHGSKRGLPCWTAIGTVSNKTPSLVWAHPVMGLCLHRPIINFTITRMVFRPSEVSPMIWSISHGTSW